MCLSGEHAKSLLSVQRKYHGKLQRTKCLFELGDKVWEEPGWSVDGKHLTLSMAAVRSQPIVRQAMLWGYKIEEMTDSFVDRAFQEGYNVVYDTMGNEPNRFLRELMTRARRGSASRS